MSKQTVSISEAIDRMETAFEAMVLGLVKTTSKYNQPVVVYQNLAKRECIVLSKDGLQCCPLLPYIGGRYLPDWTAPRQPAPRRYWLKYVEQIDQLINMFP